MLFINELISICNTGWYRFQIHSNIINELKVGQQYSTIIIWHKCLNDDKQIPIRQWDGVIDEW